MKYILLRYLLAFLFFISCSPIFSQYENYDSVTERLQELNSPESLGDTVLDKYKVETEDSLRVYKQDKEFAYMKYLDSLLRNSKAIKVDTASADAVYERKESSNKTTARMPVFNMFNNPIVKILLWIIAVGLIGILIYKLFIGNDVFKKNARYKRSKTTELNEEDSDPAYYDKLISEAVINKNFRLAIRYSYLKTLFSLAELGLIHFAADKTNYEYVKELSGNPYQNEFASITLNYEYVWYGNFEIGEDVYHRLAGKYRSFQENLNG